MGGAIKTFLWVLCVSVVLSGCCAVQPYKKVKVDPDKTITIRFTKTAAETDAQFRAYNPNASHGQVVAFCDQPGNLIVISADEFTPELLAHEIYHAVGQHWADGYHKKGD